MVLNDEKTGNSGFALPLLLIVVIIAAISAIGVNIFFQNTSKSNSEIITDLKKNIAVNPPTPSPVPFKELTIPYLRERNYESTFGALEKVRDRGSYSGYLTSFDSEGFKVNTYLAIPTGDTPPGGFPAVVFVHGYIPPAQYRTLVNYDSYVDNLASRGLVVAKIDLRGHAESEGQAFGGYYSGDYVIDTLNAYSALQKLDVVNPGKVGLWGHSMAGNITFRAFVAKNIPKLVIWAGAVYTYEDMQEFRIADNSYQPPPQESERQKYRDELFAAHGRFSPDSEFWKTVVPTNYLEGVEGEIQIHHAVDDGVVSIGYSRNLVEILNRAGIDNLLIEYPSGGHNLTGTSFTKAMESTSLFLKN